MNVTTHDEWMEAFFHTAMAMEPERLYCDGECSRTEAMRKLAELKRKWAKMEKNFGRRVTIDEAEKWWDKNNR